MAVCSQRRATLLRRPHTGHGDCSGNDCCRENDRDLAHIALLSLEAQLARLLLPRHHAPTASAVHWYLPGRKMLRAARRRGWALLCSRLRRRASEAPCLKSHGGVFFDAPLRIVALDGLWYQ